VSTAAGRRRGTPGARHGAHALVAAGVAATAVATLLPWPAAGSTRHNGFAMAEALSDLGRNLGEPTVHLIAGLWYLLPVSAGIAIVAAALDRPAGCVTAVVFHVLGAVPAVAIWWAVDRVHLHTAVAGPVLALVGCVLGGAGALAQWRTVSCRTGSSRA